MLLLGRNSFLFLTTITKPNSYDFAIHTQIFRKFANLFRCWLRILTTQLQILHVIHEMKFPASCGRDQIESYDMPMAGVKRWQLQHHKQGKTSRLRPTNKLWSGETEIAFTFTKASSNLDFPSVGMLVRFFLFLGPPCCRGIGITGGLRVKRPRNQVMLNMAEHKTVNGFRQIWPWSNEYI